MRSRISPLLISTMLAACSDKPAAPAEATDATLSPAVAARARIGVDDAIERLAPAIQRLEQKTDLRDALDRVRLAIDQRNARALERALEHAEHVLTRLEEHDDGSLIADLSAIRLQLDDARQL